MTARGGVFFSYECIPCKGGLFKVRSLGIGRIVCSETFLTVFRFKGQQRIVIMDTSIYLSTNDIHIEIREDQK